MTTTSTAAPPRGLLSRAREFILLRDAERRAATLDAETSARIARDVVLAGQRHDAAVLLWEAGSRAEAFRRAHEVFALLDPLADAAATPAPARREELRTFALPTLDADVGAVQEAQFQELMRANAAILDDLHTLSLGGSGRQRLRLLRIAVTSAALVTFVVGGAWWKLHSRIIVTASDAWGGKYAPDNVADGSEASHWLLPDGKTGWIDLQLRPPRRVHSVAILNAHDPATYFVSDYRVEARVGERVVRAFDGTFVASGTPKSWVDVPLVSGEKVDHVRVFVKSFKGIGGGLAEIEVR